MDEGLIYDSTGKFYQYVRARRQERPHHIIGAALLSIRVSLRSPGECWNIKKNTCKATHEQRCSDKLLESELEFEHL